MRENVVPEFTEMGAAYAKDTYGKTQAASGQATKGMEQTLTTLAQKVTTEAAEPLQTGVAKTFNKST